MTFMQIHPQPARGKLEQSMWRDPRWAAEEKYDGIRLVSQQDERIARFTTRRVSDVTGELQERTNAIPHLSACWMDRPIKSFHTGPGGAFDVTQVPRNLAGTVLDMEIIPCEDELRRLRAQGGGVSKAVQSILNSKPDVAVRKQVERGWLRVAIFDCLYWKGEDVRRLPLVERRRYAGCAVRTWGNPNAFLAEQIETGKKEFYDRIVKLGGEGVVLKHLDHRYGDEKLWVKVKKEQTADVIIIGFKEAKATSRKVDGTISKTKYAGKVGSVEIGQYVWSFGDMREARVLESVGFARGFSDRLMEEFTRHPKKYIGKVITIEANDREPTGKFRHPRVVDPENPFRSDKDPKSCVFDLNEK